MEDHVTLKTGVTAAKKNQLCHHRNKYIFNLY